MADPDLEEEEVEVELGASAATEPVGVVLILPKYCAYLSSTTGALWRSYNRLVPIGRFENPATLK